MGFGFDEVVGGVRAGIGPDEKDDDLLAICDVCGGECSDPEDVRHERHYGCNEEGGPDDRSDGPLEGPLEEIYENGQFAGDDDFSNISAADVL